MHGVELISLRAQLSDIYRDYRNVCLSRKYYEYRLKRVHSTNFWYEAVLAFGTSGTVAGWAFWSNPTGQAIWIGIGIIVALATIVKPILKLPDDLERLTTLSTKYAALQIDFEQLIFDIKSELKVSKALRKSYREIREKMKDLDVKGDSGPNAKLLSRCQVEVNREIPPSSLWSPQ
jgi:hypothetical protein